MGSFERYLVSRGLIWCLGATAVLTIPLVLMQSQRLADAVVNYGMPIPTYIWLLLTLTPSMAEGIMLMGIAVGLSMVLMGARASKELLAIQALGYGPGQRFRPFLVLAGALVAIQAVLTLVTAPGALEKHYTASRAYQKELSFEDALTAGVNLKISPTTYIYLDEQADDQNFTGVRMYVHPESGRPSTTFANRAVVQTARDGLSIMLFDGFQVVERPNGRLPDVVTFAAMPIVFDKIDGRFQLATKDTSSIADANAAAYEALERANSRRATLGDDDDDEDGGGGAASQPGQRSSADLRKVVHVAGKIEPGKANMDQLRAFAMDNQGQWRTQGRFPKQFETELSFLTAVFVIKNLNTDDNFTVRHIRAPSNEFHRRVSSVVAIPVIVWMLFAYLATDFHLRRPPLVSYAVVAAVTIISLIVSVALAEDIADEPRNFWALYVGALLPLPFTIVKILFSRRK